MALAELPFAGLALQIMERDNLLGSGDGADADEIGVVHVRSAMQGIHLDAIREEIAQASQMPLSDPARQERLYDLSRRQQALLTPSNTAQT